MPHFRGRLFLSIGLLFGTHQAYAQDSCALQPLIEPPTTDMVTNPQAMDIQADSMQLDANGTSHFSGHVSLTSDNRTITADELSYNSKEGSARAKGTVTYYTPDLQIIGNQAQLFNQTQSGDFVSAEILLPEVPARSKADRISNPDKNTIILENVSYTGCPAGKDDWALNAPYIKLDRARGFGVGRNVWIKFKKVPLLYTPFITFPISDQRRSGILTPEFGNSERSGTNIGVPIYWNLASNFDLITTPRHLAKRGFKLDSQFRYLFEHSTGGLEFEFLPDDERAGRNRSVAHWTNETRWNENWFLNADVTDLSDSDYFEDLGSSLANSSLTHLNRYVTLGYENEHIQSQLSFRDYITLDPNIANDDLPYERLPQLNTQGLWNVGLLEFGFNQEVAEFNRNVGVTGTRLHAAPWVSLPIQRTAWRLEPKVKLNSTYYSVDNSSEKYTTRYLPEFSFDSRLLFDRTFSLNDREYNQTLEPRLKYTHIPFRNQDDLPLFDSGLPDFNLVQLFSENRFSSIDRIGDTDNLSVGVSSSITHPDTGKRLLNATVGQSFFLSERSVQLPDELTPLNNRSNFIAEIDAPFGDYWQGRWQHVWDSENRNTFKSVVGLHYRPAPGKIINLNYRQRRDELEQTDVSFSWPVGSRWNVVGRWNYSLLDKSSLERFAGVEYNSCCWRLRLISRKFVSDNEGGTEDAFFAQLELKGLLSVGAKVDSFLERGILGYEQIQ